MSAAGNNAAARHSAYISLGSNIEPAHNLPRAIRLLGQRVELLAVSSFWEGRAVGQEAPDFWNAAAKLATPLDIEELKSRVLRPIETDLGRVRSADKFAPRSMDLDILLFDGRVMEQALWQWAYLAVPLAEIYPDLMSPDSGQLLEKVAERLARRSELRKVPQQ